MLCFVLINSIPLNLLCVKDALTVCSLVGTLHSLALTQQLGSYAFYLKNNLTMRYLSRLVLSWLSGSKCWVEKDQADSLFYKRMSNWLWIEVLSQVYSVLQTDVELTLRIEMLSGLTQFYRLTLSWLSGSKCWVGWLSFTDWRWVDCQDWSAEWFDSVLQTDVKLTLWIEVLSEKWPGWLTVLQTDAKLTGLKCWAG